MKEFLLLFRGGDAERKQLSPEQIEAHMKRWQDWIGSIARKNILVGAQPLESGGRVLKGTSKKLTDGPFMEGKEVLGGYVLLKANTIEEATEIAKGCPNLEAESGTVEIREIGVMQAM
ncbi:MAG: YciI family protein [Bacteroidia bacterium]